MEKYDKLGQLIELKFQTDGNPLVIEMIEQEKEKIANEDKEVLIGVYKELVEPKLAGWNTNKNIYFGSETKEDYERCNSLTLKEFMEEVFDTTHKQKDVYLLAKVLFEIYQDQVKETFGWRIKENEWGEE